MMIAKINLHCILKWVKEFLLTVSSSTSTSCLIAFLFHLYFCILSNFEIIRCIVKALIASSMYFLLKYNWKKKIWKVLFRWQKFQCPNWHTGLPIGLNTSLVIYIPIMIYTWGQQKIHCYLNGNELEKYASIYANIN